MTTQNCASNQAGFETSGMVARHRANVLQLLRSRPAPSTTAADVAAWLEQRAELFTDIAVQTNDARVRAEAACIAAMDRVGAAWFRANAGRDDQIGASTSPYATSSSDMRSAVTP